MRIALDATYSVADEPTGIAVYSQELLNGLPQLFPQHEYRHCYRWKQWLQVKAAGRLLAPPFPTFRSDVFHALNQRVERRPAKHVVSTFHDLFVMTSEYSSREFRERFTEQARTAASNSDLVIAVSQFTASQVEHLLGTPRSRIRVVPHGVHPPQREHHPTDPPFILCVGAIQKRKNIGRLVAAFETLAEPWRLVLAGSPTGYGSLEILERVAASPARRRIELTNYVSPARLASLYATASIFAFPSLDEGFGIPVLEAMSYGVPVLTSNTSALKEVAADSALLVDPHDTESIAASLHGLISDAGLRAGLSSLGRRRAAQFTWHQTVRATHAVYLETLNS